ncbi:MAG: hypothetical protein ABR543_09325 [Gemmatimonadaceae bacterium]
MRDVVARGAAGILVGAAVARAGAGVGSGVPRHPPATMTSVMHTRRPDVRLITINLLAHTGRGKLVKRPESSSEHGRDFSGAVCSERDVSGSVLPDEEQRLCLWRVDRKPVCHVRIASPDY